MARPSTSNPAQIASDEINAEIERAVASLAAELGPAPGAATVSDAKRLQLWTQQDPTVDYDSLVQQLQTQGLPPELLDPESEQALAIVKAHPEMAQLYQAPVAPDVAATLAVLAEYPFRLSLLQPYEDDPAQLVKEANRLDAAWQRQQARSAQTGGARDG